MTQELITTQPSELSITPDQLALIKRTVLKPKNRQATDDELALFSHQASRTGLDPLARQIYGVYRYDKRANDEVMSIQVSIDGFRLVAQRSGKYLGQTPVYWADAELNWYEVWAKPGQPTAAKVGVYVKGAPEPTWGVARFTAYADTRSPIWKSMGDVMIAKCAEALALRRAFPAELSGLYTADEMDQAEPTPAAPSQVEPKEPTPMDELAQLVDEVGFSDEEKGGLRAWIKQDREVHTETAIELLKDGNKNAVLAGIEFEATVEA